VPLIQRPLGLATRETRQRKDSLAMYNNLVFRCFDECSKVRRAIWQLSFRSKRLDDGETKCINVCAEKYIKLTSRVALRFQDIQQQRAKDEAAGVQR
ncbi:unnamed protein product, partial [Ectocarpus fasciculatus]